MVEIKKFPSPVFIIYEHSKYIPKLWIISWSLSVSTIYCILILYSQLPIPAIGCRLDPCLDASCLPGRVYLIIVTVPWCHGAMVAVGYLETLLKVAGWWEKMSSRPGQAAVAGDVLCCLALSFLDYEGSLLLSSPSPPDDQLYCAVLGNSNTLTGPLLSHSVFLGQQTSCQSFRGFNFSLE